MNRAEIEILRNRASNIVENTGNYSLEMFLEDYPQFKDADGNTFANKAIMSTFIKMCNSTVSEERWAESWRLACGLFVAHYLTLYLRQNKGATCSKNATEAADSGALLGVVTSASLGDASVSYDVNVTTQATEAWGQFNLTTYGQQYASLARMYCIGGMYVF